MNKENSKYKVGMYIRLSKEDEKKEKKNESESQSIINQRNLIEKYIKEQGFTLAEEYVDDGYSGTTFDRPGFNKLLSDIEQNKINTVITKDLSRLGRDYIKSGYYIEQYFPLKKVRYISILDNIYTYKEDVNNDIAPFKALFNDMVSKDTSRKIRSILRNKKEAGLFLGSSSSFGYKIDPKDKHKLVIDEKTAPIVKKIFNLALKGISRGEICTILNKENIPTPIIYKGKKVAARYTSPKIWTTSSIRNILTNEMYTGTLIQGRQAKLSYKSNKRIVLDKNSWIIKENNHEPIITQEEFEIVNKKTYKKQSTKSKNNHSLQGLLYCKECGCRLGIKKDYRYENKYIINCNKYTRNPKLNLCTSHFMVYNTLEKRILTNVKELCKNINQEKLINDIKNELEKEEQQKNNQNKNLENELINLNRKLKTLYDDKYNGSIKKETFLTLLKAIEEEIKTVKKGINQQKNQTKKPIQKEEINKLINGIPTNELLCLLIDKIYINNQKEIEINYNFSPPMT